MFLTILHIFTFNIFNDIKCFIQLDVLKKISNIFNDAKCFRKKFNEVNFF